eukprot:CAMPEP_0171353130 /NCGR_PEP_ID=MMETSP0878-20121228/43345_1 /TAXON_ID=67004 /ORGANISM="Thalassiosira weissflogii, Strain CCMP1336" /LENGTH=36 /DNA_ID= /DNA_START= /DNA_END= /DNA_ORIENTATION=
MTQIVKNWESIDRHIIGSNGRCYDSNDVIIEWNAVS